VSGEANMAKLKVN